MKKGNLYILITLVITLWLHTGCSASTDTKISSPHRLNPDNIASLKSDAEKLFAARADISKLRESVAALSKARDPEARDFEVEWKYAKLNYFLGRHTPDQKEAESSFAAGRDAAKIASNVQPEKPDGYFWYAANLGELCKRSPVTVGLQSVEDVKQAMNKVLELEPGYQGASAYDGLAQVEMGTRLNGGSLEKAVEYLEKGLSIEDDNSNLHLHLAEALLALDRDADAKKQIEILLKLTPNPEYIPEHNQSVEAARKMLQTKF